VKQAHTVGHLGVVLITDLTAIFFKMSTSSTSSLPPRGSLSRKIRLPVDASKYKASPTPNMPSKEDSSAVEKPEISRIKNSSSATAIQFLSSRPTRENLNGVMADSEAEEDQMVEWTIYGALQWKDGVISRLDEVNSGESSDVLDVLEKDLDTDELKKDQNDDELDKEWEMVAAEGLKKLD
jgi:hypothetical protein